MRWESEKWRKLYRRTGGSWLRLPLLARGLGSELLKYAEDDGRIPVMADESTGDAICRLTSAHKSEWKAVANLAQKLLDDGYLVREPDAILIRNFVPAQRRSSNAERQARYRERHRNREEEGQEDDVPDGDVASLVTVTSNGSRYAQVTSELSNEVTDRALCLSLSSSGSISSQIPEDPEIAGARDSEPRANGWALEPPTPVKRRPRKKSPEVPLPADWQPTKEHRAFAAKHGIDLETEVFGFRGWAEGVTRVNWNGTFSTRLSNHVQWAAERAAKGGAKNGRPTPHVQHGGWSREDAERNRPVLGEGDEV